MNVLFWVDKFPRFSETFIRDQIINLLDRNINVIIYTSSKKDFSEKEALTNIEQYTLLDKVISEEDILVRNNYIRVLKALLILLKSVFSFSFKYYMKSLNKKKYGRKASSLRFFYFVHFILKNKIEVIHAHYGPNGLKASMFKEIGLPVKLFTTFHGYDIRLGKCNGTGFYNSLFKNANGIISISKFNKENLLLFGANEDIIIDLPNGIDTSFFKRITPNVCSGTIQFLSVARLVEEKALHIAMEAFATVIKNNPHLKLGYTIIGDGILWKKLKLLANELGITTHLKFFGKRNTLEVRNEMRSANVFLLSSIAEALPTVLLEAQSCELVVVASNVGSVDEMVKGGVVVAANSIEEFTNGIQNIIDNRDRWLKISEMGRIHIVKNHNIEEKTNALIKYYKKL